MDENGPGKMAASGSQADMAADFGAPSSVTERDILLRRLADLAVLPSGRMTPQERNLVDTVIAAAVSRLDDASRRRLAERIAQLPEGPRELTLALARDTIEVAAPVLRASLGLQPTDLVQIVREFGPEHHLAIAGRKALPAAVTDALVEYAASPAITRFLSNAAAEMSMRALEVLVRRSASEPEFQPLLLARAEMTVRLAQLMFWWVPSAARIEILSRFSVERRMMHDALDDVLEAGLAAAGADEALHATLSLVRPPVFLDKTLLTRLVNLAGTKRSDEFTETMADGAHIHPETARRIVGDQGGEPLAVYGKAVGLTRKEFGDLIVAAAEIRLGDMPGRADLERVTAVFDAISTDRAAHVLHCWDWATSAEAQIPTQAES
ncbi:MAG TPA: DUF2336 domain-containing protein [Parvibaculum sp.]